jgi:hypothetical protein
MTSGPTQKLVFYVANSVAFFLCLAKRARGARDLRSTERAANKGTTKPLVCSQVERVNIAASSVVEQQRRIVWRKSQ